MAWWNRKAAQPEARANIENPLVPISAYNIIEFLGASGISASGVAVTIENALGVPAIWAAVNFIAGTMAGLPLQLYKKTEAGREHVGDDNPLAAILHRAVNDECSSYEWRKHLYDQVLSGGRSVTFIERDGTDKVINLWPLDPDKVTVRRKDGKKFYIYREGRRAPVTYEAAEVIDIPFMLKADMLQHRSPIFTNKDTIGLAIAATTYGSKLFNNGGIPPFVMTGNFQTGAGLKRASQDLEDAVKAGNKENRLALTLPAGHEIKPLGLDPEKSQLVELKRFIIEEIARIYSLPPSFLQDLTNGTFSNVEQQDLHLVKHTIKKWVEQAEQEFNLKLFGRAKTDMYVEFNMDGLLRGDFKTRMEGYAQGIQNGVLKPNEARRLENRLDDPEGDKLMIQGATVPLGSQPTQTPKGATA